MSVVVSGKRTNKVSLSIVAGHHSVCISLSTVWKPRAQTRLPVLMTPSTTLWPSRARLERFRTPPRGGGGGGGEGGLAAKRPEQHDVSRVSPGSNFVLGRRVVVVQPSPMEVRCGTMVEIALVIHLHPRAPLTYQLRITDPVGSGIHREPRQLIGNQRKSG